MSSNQAEERRASGRSKSAGRQRSSSSKRSRHSSSNRSSLSPHRLRGVSEKKKKDLSSSKGQSQHRSSSSHRSRPPRDAQRSTSHSTSKQQARHSSRGRSSRDVHVLSRQTSTRRRAEASNTRNKEQLQEHLKRNESPGSLGIANHPVGARSRSLHTLPTLPSLKQPSPASTTDSKTSSTMSPNSNKTNDDTIDSPPRRHPRISSRGSGDRSANSSRSPTTTASRLPPRVVKEERVHSSVLQDTAEVDSNERQMASRLFQEIDSCSWKDFYEQLRRLAEQSSSDTLSRILSMAADEHTTVDQQYESTVLHTCVWKAPPALTKFVLDVIPNTADVCLTTDADGNTPLHLCCANLPISHDGSVDTSVLKRLANLAPRALHLANNNGDTPLHLLVSSSVCCCPQQETNGHFDVKIAEEVVACILSVDESTCRLQDATGALPLHIAIACGADEVVLVKLLEVAPNVATAKDECGMLPIHYVAAHGRTPLTVVDLLMEAHPGSIYDVTVNGDTPLHILASNASVSMAGLSAQRMDMETETMIEFLTGSTQDDDSRATDEESVTSYAGNRRPLLAINKEQMNPLHCCALFNAPSQLVGVLMKNPLAARAALMTNEFGATPLHVACAQATVADSVTQVASLGTAASAAALDRHRRTPLHVAAQNSRATGDLIKVLTHLHPGALSEQTQRGHLPLHLAAQSQVNETVVKALIASYPEAAEARNKSNNTPLHDAAKYRASKQVVKLLLDSYPDAVYIQNQYGNLPLHCATAYQAPPEVVLFLLEAWPDGAAMQNRNKDASLHYAAAFSTSLEVIRPLIDAAPAAVLLLNSSGQSPIDRAKTNNAPADIVNLLEESAGEWTTKATTGGWQDALVPGDSRSTVDEERYTMSTF